MKHPRSGHKRLIVILLLIALAAVIASPFFGAAAISVRSAFSIGMEKDVLSPDDIIFWEMRVPRVLLGFLIGAALAISGMSFQAIFRNPLATPFILGVSAGASLGVAVYIKLGPEIPVYSGKVTLAFLGASAAKMTAAFLGAVAAILLVYALTRIKKGFTSSTLLLAGVSVSFFFSSVILFVQYISEATHALMILRWLMGSLVHAEYFEIYYILPFVCIGAFLLYYLRNELNLILVGEDIAASRGVNVKRTKLLIFFVMSLVVGAVVAVTGPIGFVGMMVPHICRLLIGPDSKRLIPACLLFGGAFLVVCDALARSARPPADIPVAVITALVGGPFFIYLLIRRQSERSIF